MRRPSVESSWLDRAAAAVSPRWGAARMANKIKIAAFTEAGYIVPGSRKKTMKGVVASANSPDADVNGKLSPMRAISRDLYMNSPLATSILRRHRSNVIGSGLQLQARVDRDVLGLSEDEAEQWEAQAEREFDLWAGSVFCDYDARMTFPELQSVAFLNMLMSGDVFFFLPMEDAPDPAFPYSTRIKLIDADLVRDPAMKEGRDIEGGVERDQQGRTVAIHVWNTYENEYVTAGKTARSIRVPIFSASGRQQVFQIAEFERIGQRRGIPLLAPAVEPLKQLTRLSEAQLMNALVSAYFTVFVKDISGMGATLGAAFTPEESVFGVGRYGPGEAQVGTMPADSANDLEMGHANITYLDKDTDITVADPRKVDTGFEPFWKSLANQVTAVGGMPLETAMINYTTSYTAARAAAIDAWKEISGARARMDRRFCSIAYDAIIEEAVLRRRVVAQRFFDDLLYRRAWTGASWIGAGMGAINPLDEAKAAAFNLANYTTTREEEYMARTGGRWDSAMQKRAREEALLRRTGLREESPAPTDNPDAVQRTPGDTDTNGAI